MKANKLHRDQFWEVLFNSRMRNRMRELQSLRDQFFESIASDHTNHSVINSLNQLQAIKPSVNF